MQAEPGGRSDADIPSAGELEEEQHGDHARYGKHSGISCCIAEAVTDNLSVDRNRQRLCAGAVQHNGRGKLTDHRDPTHDCT